MFGNTFKILCSLPWFQGPAPEDGKPLLPPKTFSTPTRTRAFIRPCVLIGIVQLLSHVWLFVITCSAIKLASLSFTISWSFLKLMSIESVMPFHSLILLTPLLLPTIFPSIRVSSNELALHISGPKGRSSSSASVFALNIVLPPPNQNSCFQSPKNIEHW